jgi:hypothetical protein
MYETGDWPKDLMEVTMIALKKKPETTKRTRSNCHTVSLISHTAKILTRRIRRKMEDVLG